LIKTIQTQLFKDLNDVKYENVIPIFYENQYIKEKFKKSEEIEKKKSKNVEKIK
jgi:hypothetical protein